MGYEFKDTFFFLLFRIINIKYIALEYIYVCILHLATLL